MQNPRWSIEAIDGGKELVIRDTNGFAHQMSWPAERDWLASILDAFQALSDYAEWLLPTHSTERNEDGAALIRVALPKGSEDELRRLLNVVRTDQPLAPA